jgi:hypothetical protein
MGSRFFSSFYLFRILFRIQPCIFKADPDPGEPDQAKSLRIRMRTGNTEKDAVATGFLECICFLFRRDHNQQAQCAEPALSCQSLGGSSRQEGPPYFPSTNILFKTSM